MWIVVFIVVNMVVIVIVNFRSSASRGFHEIAVALMAIVVAGYCGKVGGSGGW